MAGMKKKVKRLVSDLNTKRHIIKEKDEINRYIRVSNEQVAQLTEQQKQEIVSYWAQFGISVGTSWHRLFYFKTGNPDPRFVPRTVFNYTVKPKMNDERFVRGWGDKAYLDYFLRDVKTPQCIVRNVSGRLLNESFELISRQEAIEILGRYERFVVKPAVDTDTGKGVKLMTKPFDFEALFREYKANYVCQIPIQQHEGMMLLNQTSVNTIRMNTVLLGKEAHVMSCFVKVGEAGKFADNNGSQRFFIGIDPQNGTMRDYAIDHSIQKYSSIPSGYAFAGEKIPCFDKVCEAVCRAHRSLPHFGFAFWDVAVDAEGDAVIIEVNLRRPDTNVAQGTGQPFFGEYTDVVMKAIRKL